MPFLHFIIQQVKLLGVTKNDRRYSTNMITTAFLWQLTNRSLYKKLNFFMLPLIRQLHNFQVLAQLRDILNV